MPTRTGREIRHAMEPRQPAQATRAVPPPCAVFSATHTILTAEHQQKRSPPTGLLANQHHTCSSAVGGYCPGLSDGLSVATGAPFEGTSEAIPAAAETGFGAGVLRDSSAPAELAVLVFTNELVPF